jgi:hypothetical protein
VFVVVVVVSKVPVSLVFARMDCRGRRVSRVE